MLSDTKVLTEIIDEDVPVNTQDSRRVIRSGRTSPNKRKSGAENARLYVVAPRTFNNVRVSTFGHELADTYQQDIESFVAP